MKKRWKMKNKKKRWNKNIFQLLARDKVYKKISICLSLAIQESTNTFETAMETR